ncbi:MAG: hypothetical protein Q3X51_04670 [Bifidobacterium sp.]|uniref:hypothetical protein n=1 Tax=Bifidobacterium sp. TaxID=41200 RepID=UPI00284BC518|nr:hypothetical protein [Bifidobacterium sp.]MDR3887565.1 hypothetical protein [Bifidobacterium sp.]
MTAPQAVSQQNPSKVAFGKVLAIQIVAYVVLVALALVPGIAYGDSANPAVVPFTIIGSLAMIALLVVFSPFRDGTAGHVIAVIAGLLSVVCATTMTLGRAIFAADATGGKDFSMEDGWIAGVGGLLILLIVISFGRQMARENRTHLIRSLSHSVVEGVAMIASAGWCFLPTVLKAIGTVAFVVVLLVIVALAVCSYFWHRDADPESTARDPWIGIAMLPVMIAGAVVGIAALAVVTF